MNIKATKKYLQKLKSVIYVTIEKIFE